MNLTRPKEEVYTRGVQIRRMLRPLSRDNDIAWKHRSVRREYTISTHDGSPSSSDLSGWRFHTYVKNYLASYYETWIQDTAETYYLHRAYLHIYNLNVITGEQKELIGLHCDPNEADTEAHWLYKRSPHLHIMVAPAPFAHAHLALALANLNDVMGSISKLEEVLEWSILMIKDEILDPIQQQGL